MGFFDAILGGVGGSTGRAIGSAVGGGVRDVLAQRQAQGQRLGGAIGGAMVNLGKLGPPQGGAFGPLYGNPALNNPALRPTIGGGGESLESAQQRLGRMQPPGQGPWGGGMDENTRLRMESERAGYGYGGRRPDQVYSPGVRGGGLPEAAGYPSPGSGDRTFEMPAYQNPEFEAWFRDQQARGIDPAQSAGTWAAQHPPEMHALGGGGGGGGLIRLVAPTGEQRDVPPDVAEQMLARGARRI